MHASSTPAVAALACAIGLAALPQIARGDWNAATDARWRHDSNVGNSEYVGDRSGDSSVAARLAVFDLLTLGHDYSLVAGADVSGESYARYHGLNNASLGGTLALKKKWGLGALAPWVRVSLSAARADYDGSYRNAAIARSVVSAGRRIDERWNLSADYTFERRRAVRRLDAGEPGISSDAYSQTGHALGAKAQYTFSEPMFLTAGVMVRHGDVVSTTHGDRDIFTASHAVADDPAFGADAYAYRLTGTTYGLKLGINYTPAAHHLLGLSFARFETHAGGATYTKSMPELSWDFSY